MTTLGIYVLIAAAAIAIAFLLAHLAKLTNSVSKIDHAQEKLNLSATQTQIQQTILNKLSNLTVSPQQRQQISQEVSSLFTQELESKINVVSQGLTEKYQGIIDQKTKQEQLAWEKYNQASNEKKDTEAIIHSVAEGLVVVDAQGKVIMMNPAAEKLLGVEKKDKIGQPVMENLKPEQLISLVKTDETKGDKEIELSSANDETKKILRASSAIIENENGKTVGMVPVLSDITKERELERLKANFLASVSHELRTPLVAMGKSIDVLLDKSSGTLSPTQEQFLLIVQRNAKRLTKLINDLLDTSKLEAGKMALQKQPSLLTNIIIEAIDNLQTWAKTKSIIIEIKLPDNLPLINIDSGRILQVLTNLIGNAIKFTPANGTITITAEKTDENVIVSIQDTGIGIAENELTKIFDKFYQSRERSSSDINGTGLGLTIAQEIIQLHEGKIWAESNNHQGTKFIFTLPCKL